MDNATDLQPRRRVERIIWEFGGITVLSDKLGLSRVSVWKWQDKNSIPSRWQSELLRLAKENGIELKAEDLIG